MVKLRVIAAAVRGVVDGDADFAVAEMRSLEHARGAALTFCADAKNAKLLSTCQAGAVLLSAEYASAFPRHKIVVENPYAAYARASNLFVAADTDVDTGADTGADTSAYTGARIHPTASIAPSAAAHRSARIGAYSVIGARTQIGKDAVIGSHCAVGADCEIGAGSFIDSGVQIYARVRLGKNCRIASGAVLGGSGFGYAEERGRWLRIAQLGGVCIGDDVDVGANTTIDRGALEDTVIGDGVKMDNQIQIAHNVRIGAHTILAGCVAVAGSAIIGARCQLGGRVSVLGHLTLADDVRVNANSLVARSLPKAGVYAALIPAQPVAQWRKTLARFNRLEKLVARRKLR